MTSPRFALALGLLTGCSVFGGAPGPERLARLQRSPQFAEGRFVNELRTPTDVSPSRVGRTLSEAAYGDQIRTPRGPLPWVDPGDLSEAAELRITWMGHSSLLVELDGHRILTDPIWSARCSPVSFAGPERFLPAPLPLDALPPVDAVVISHDHYDHLDEATIRSLATRGTRFFVPIGVGSHLAAWGVPAEQVEELDWWQTARVGAITLVATPARHFSGRGLSDRDQTLWASWALVGPRHRVYFGGDTGLFPGFLEIGRRYGPFDVTILPIGAYDRRWRPMHMDPEEAVLAHQMLRGDRLVPVHWATFNLAFHDWFEPGERLLMAARRAGVSVATPLVGAPLVPGAATGPWWREAAAAEVRPSPNRRRLGLERVLRARAFSGPR